MSDDVLDKYGGLAGEHSVQSLEDIKRTGILEKMYQQIKIALETKPVGSYSLGISESEEGDVLYLDFYNKNGDILREDEMHTLHDKPYEIEYYVKEWLEKEKILEGAGLVPYKHIEEAKEEGVKKEKERRRARTGNNNASGKNTANQDTIDEIVNNTLSIDLKGFLREEVACEIKPMSKDQFSVRVVDLERQNSRQSFSNPIYTVYGLTADFMYKVRDTLKKKGFVTGRIGEPMPSSYWKGKIIVDQPININGENMDIENKESGQLGNTGEGNKKAVASNIYAGPNELSEVVNSDIKNLLGRLDDMSPGSLKVSVKKFSSPTATILTVNIWEGENSGERKLSYLLNKNFKAEEAVGTIKSCMDKHKIFDTKLLNDFIELSGKNNRLI